MTKNGINKSQTLSGKPNKLVSRKCWGLGDVSKALHFKESWIHNSKLEEGSYICPDFTSRNLLLELDTQSFLSYWGNCTFPSKSKQTSGWYTYLREKRLKLNSQLCPTAFKLMFPARPMSQSLSNKILQVSVLLPSVEIILLSMKYLNIH